MKLTGINANLLIALDLLLTEESVSRAADRHGVTASAMSHSLRALRDLFGDALLTKTRTGMRPTPYATSLKGPLHRALRDLERAVSTAPGFDAAASGRGFVLASPDFISTLLLPHVMRLIAERSPRIDVEVRPLRRHGSGLWLRDAAALAEGDIDLVVAAVLGDVPEINTEPLYDERFVCIVREDHPQVGETLDVETFTRVPHLLVTITDERTSSWVDEQLARQGLMRRVAMRTRYFMSAPLLVARTDLIATVPYQVARHFRSQLPLRLLEPPIELPAYQEFLAWHRRYDADPGLVWLRGLLKEAARAATAE